MSDHKNENAKFKMEITNKFHDALTRQANEAVQISSRPDQELLNSKAEFNHPPLASVVIEKKPKQFQNLFSKLNETFIILILMDIVQSKLKKKK